MKELKQRMKNLKNKILLFLLFALNIGSAISQDFRVSLIKDKNEKDLIENAVTSVNKDDEVVQDQIVSIVNGYNSFILAPVISTAQKNGGCYLQSVKNNHEIGPRYLLEKNEDVQSCDAIIAIFACKLTTLNGIGIITGIRLGANHYYTESLFFNVTKNNDLKLNTGLSKKISKFDSTAKAKNGLGCLK